MSVFRFPERVNEGAARLVAGVVAAIVTRSTISTSPYFLPADVIVAPGTTW